MMCAVTMITSGVTGSVGAVELVTKGVTSNDTEVNELNECIKQLGDRLNFFSKLAKSNLKRNIFGAELCKSIQNRIELIDRLNKIKVSSVKGIDDLKAKLKDQEQFIDSVYKAVARGYVNEQLVNTLNKDYNENLLKAFNSWYYSGVVLYSEDNINTNMKEKRDKLRLFKITMLDIKEKIKKEKEKLDNRNLQDRNRLIQLEDLKKNVKKFENRLETENFEDSSKLVECEVDINKIASECGLLHDIKKNYDKVYDEYKETFKRFCEITNKFSVWRDYNKIDKNDETIRPERVAVLNLGLQLQNNFDVGLARVFLQSANRVIEKMDAFKKNYKKTKVDAVKKLPDEVQAKVDEFKKLFNKLSNWKKVISKSLFRGNSKIGISFKEPGELKYSQPRGIFFNNPEKSSCARALVSKVNPAKKADKINQQVIRMYQQTIENPTSENIKRLIKLGDEAIKEMNLVLNLKPFLDIIEESENLEDSESEDLQFANLDLDSDGFYELLSVDPDSYDGDIE